MSQLGAPRTTPVRATKAPGSDRPWAPVLLVTPWHLPSVGGVARVAERLRQGLVGAGVEVHLLVCAETRRIEADPVLRDVWRFGIASSAFYSSRPVDVAATLLRAPSSLWRLLRFVRERRIGTVILLYPIAYAWPFVLLRHLLGTRLVVSLHGGDLRGYDGSTAPARWLLRRVLRSADEVVVCAPHLATMAEALVPGSGTRARLIPNSVDLCRFTPAPAHHVRSDPRPAVLHVSNFATVKRTCDIVEAFASARVPAEARLVMVGAGPELERTRAHARRLGIADRVHFAGSQDDVRPFFWDADLFVLASEAEGAPLVLVEAMACGVPWVSTPWGVAAELPAGECGVTVAPRDPEALAGAIGGLLRDPARRHGMARRARERAVTDYGEDRYLRRHLELIARQ